MPELRVDPLSGLRVIVAGERGDRPGAFLAVGQRPPIDPERDPFLEGHEDQTPPEVYALRPDGGAPDGPGWRVRVVPNLYPALAGDEIAMPEPPERGEPDLFLARPAAGAHEVIVNSPRPVSSLLELEPGEVADAMGVWRTRMAAHNDAALVHLIVNEGQEAGASLPHTHAQLYALPFVPAAVARERERFTAYSDRPRARERSPPHPAPPRGRTLPEPSAREGSARRDRLVAVDDDAVAFCPFASQV